MPSVGTRPSGGAVFGDLPGVFLGLKQSWDECIPTLVMAFALCSRQIKASIFGSSYFSHQPGWRASRAGPINSAVFSEPTSIDRVRILDIA